jgi:predicted Rossmann fold flavoprotein
VAHDVIVLGGGAAGLFAAATAGRRGRKVLVLEGEREPGRKILISGGGRCNFTNLHCRPEHFLSSNPHFARSALARYTPQHFIELVERYGIAFHEKTLGQLFCDGSSRQILDLLLAECAAARVEIVADCRVAGVRPGPGGTAFTVQSTHGVFEASSVIVATGGLSIAKLGATDVGYRIAREFGLRVVAPRPALVPLLFSDEDRRRWSDLSGVAAPVEARAGEAAFRERILFTHRGLSGPAILQASSYWRHGEPIQIDLLPGVDLAGDLRSRRQDGDTQTTRAAVARYLPRRLAERWFELHARASVVAATGNDDLDALAAGLHRWVVVPAGSEGYDKAEVTAGGVDTHELSSQTMEARRVRGLYFIGEVVDVTGHLGGFNFQWAWASGQAAGEQA